jgi:DNA-binding CsgD family transcriptional regulator
MEEVEQASSLIGDIYGAAIDPALWTAVLRRAREFVGGSAAALFTKDAARKTLSLCYDDGGIDPHYKQLYFDTYVKLDPVTASHACAEIERPVSMADLGAHVEIVESRFYKEWAQPQGLVDFVCAVLDKSAAGAAMFGVFRHERHGIVDDRARKRMCLIVPHIRRAVHIGRAIDLKAAEAATFADVLDGLTAGMFLVDATGGIVHANANGHAMLQEGSVLRTRGGRLVAAQASAAAALAQIIPAAGCRETAIGTKGIAVPLSTSDGGHYVAHVLPLAHAALQRAMISHPTVAFALFVHKVELDVSSSPPEAIARLYKLTPSELRVLLAIVQVGGVPETAEALGIADTTVKTHLHRLFGKTGAARQADLVKLIAAFSNPLVARPKDPGTCP